MKSRDTLTIAGLILAIVGLLTFGCALIDGFPHGLLGGNWTDFLVFLQILAITLVAIIAAILNHLGKLHIGKFPAV